MQINREVAQIFMKKRFKQAAAVISAAAMAFSLVGCGGGEAAATDAASGSAEASASADAQGAASSAELNVMLDTPVLSLDPQQATDGTSFEVIADFTDGLMQVGKDGTPEPAVAESYEVSDDGMTYTFHLRDGVNWSNGTPVTAADFVFGWQRAVDPAVASEYAYMLSDIAQIKNAAEIIAGTADKSTLGVTAVDEKTLKVELNSPVSYFVSLMYFPTFYPVNEAFFNETGDVFGTSPETTLSNGAFILDTYEPAATAFHLTKNEKYWDVARVKAPGLNYQVIQDSQQALMSYQAGDIDITRINGDQVDQVMDDPSFSSSVSGFLWFVSPNVHSVPELQNRNIRLALSLAIDRDALTTDVLKDGSQPTNTLVPQQFAFGPDGTDFAADQTEFADLSSYNPEKAAEYWEKGLSELGISSLELEMILDADDAPQKVAQVLKEQWEGTLPGLTVNLKVEPKKQRLSDMTNDNYQLGLTRWGPDYADPMTYLGIWTTGNSYNYGQWSNADYDAAIAEATTGALATDPQGRWEKLHEAEKIALEDAVVFPLYSECNAIMTSPSVTGIEFPPVAIKRVFKDAVKAE